MPEAVQEEERREGVKNVGLVCSWAESSPQVGRWLPLGRRGGTVVYSRRFAEARPVVTESFPNSVLNSFFAWTLFLLFSTTQPLHSCIQILIILMIETDFPSNWEVVLWVRNNVVCIVAWVSLLIQKPILKPGTVLGTGCRALSCSVI